MLIDLFIQTKQSKNKKNFLLESNSLHSSKKLKSFVQTYS